MDPTIILNGFDAALIIGVSIPTVWMATRISRQPLRTLSLMLATFLLFHGIYHLVEALATYQNSDAIGALSDAVIEPAGWLLLFGFMVFYYRRG